MKIAVQLYTLRKQAKSDLWGTLCQLSKTGIRCVEAARLPFDDKCADTFVRAAEECGIEVVSAQIHPKKLQNQYDMCLSFLKKTKCTTAVMSVLPTKYILGDNARLAEFCTYADGLAQKFASDGIRLCYHHHDFEFVGNKSQHKFDIICSQTKQIGLVFDTYWLTKAGVNIPDLIRQHKDRLCGLHLRGYRLARAAHGIGGKAQDCSLADSAIDFAAIIRAAEECGVPYGAIEQNAKNAWQELAKSQEHLEKIMR